MGGATKNNPEECILARSRTPTPVLKELTYSTMQADQLRGPLQLALELFRSNRPWLDRIPHNQSRCRLSATYFRSKERIVPISMMSGKGELNEDDGKPALLHRQCYGESQCLTQRVRQHLSGLMLNSSSACEGAHHRAQYFQ